MPVVGVCLFFPSANKRPFLLHLSVSAHLFADGVYLYLFYYVYIIREINVISILSLIIPQAHNRSIPHPPFSYPKCSGAKSPGLAADMHFRDDVIAFIGPACAFALEPVARLASYWNTPVITGMGDQVRVLSSWG